MISLDNACEIALNGYNDKPYIVSITDIDYAYAIMVSWDPEVVSTCDGVIAINKISGDIRGYAYPQIINEVRRGKKLDVPEKYAYQKK